MYVVVTNPPMPMTSSLMSQIKTDDGRRLSVISPRDTRLEGEYRVGDVVAYQKQCGELIKGEHGFWDVRMDDDGKEKSFVSARSLVLIQSKRSPTYSGK
jgi:hypothetical protein